MLMLYIKFSPANVCCPWNIMENSREKVLIAYAASADNCLTKSATARGRSQSTLRFARSAPDLVEHPATPTALCSAPASSTLITAKSDSQLSKRSAAAAQRALHDSPSSRTRQQRRASQEVYPDQCQATSPFLKAAEAAAVTQPKQSPQRRSAGNDSARSPDQVPSPDRKRSRVSWSTHDTDSSRRRFQAAASPSTAGNTACLQPRASFGSPRRKTPQSRRLSAEATSNASLLQSPSHIAEPDSRPGPTEPHSLLQAGREPSQGSQQSQVSHHTKSASAGNLSQPQQQRSGLPQDPQQHSSSNGSEQRISASQCNSFHTFAVGRRFRQVAMVVPGQRAFLRHQPSNPKDPNALMVVSCLEAARGPEEQPAEQLLGYLPATVAASLVALVQEGAADISVTVLESPKTPRASLPITVQVFTCTPG